MDDEAVFGPVFHRLTFSQAIEQDLLSDYQVVIVGVDDATYKAWAEHGKYVTRDGTKITDARRLAGQIGLARAMRKFDLRRVITFHSRVAAARRFSDELPDVIAWMPSGRRPTGRIQAGYVSGAMPTGDRRRRLSQLAKPKARSRVLLSNARCLAEGIDVPTLDGVAFIDPRRSEVDIIQAVGRAIRKAPDKKTGTIVLPVFIEASGDPEQVLEDSAFKPVWDVIRALRSHDEELAEQLDTIRRALARGAGSTVRLPSKLKVLVPASVSVDFAEAFDTRVIEQATAPWEYWFGLLEAFVAREDHARVPNAFVENGFRLGQWVTEQRHNHSKSILSEERASRLEALPGWSWDVRADRWEDGFAHTASFAAREGHARVPKGNIEDGFRLGTWIGAQRMQYTESTLPTDRVRRLEALPGWSWDTRTDTWEKNFAVLERFVAREGHARVPIGHIEDGVRLGTWVTTQRTSHTDGEMSGPRLARLEALPGWSWAPIEGQWEDTMALLKQFVAREGHARVSIGHIEDGVQLGKWVHTQRSAYKRERLSVLQVTRLEALPGWSWGPYMDTWEKNFAVLEQFVAREGHARVPVRQVENGFRLRDWVALQRAQYRGGKMSGPRVARLEALPGWSWALVEDQWEDKFAMLERFVAREGHARVAFAHVEDGVQLGWWVNGLRTAYKRKQLSKERVARFEALPGWLWKARSATEK
jgi:hypothetical protein